MYLPASREQLSDILQDLELFCRLEQLTDVLEPMCDARILLHMADLRSRGRTATGPEDRDAGV